MSSGLVGAAVPEKQRVGDMPSRLTSMNHASRLAPPGTRFVAVTTPPVSSSIQLDDVFGEGERRFCHSWTEANCGAAAWQRPVAAACVYEMSCAHVLARHHLPEEAGVEVVAPARDLAVTDFEDAHHGDGEAGVARSDVVDPLGEDHVACGGHMAHLELVGGGEHGPLPGEVLHRRVDPDRRVHADVVVHDVVGEERPQRGPRPAWTPKRRTPARLLLLTWVLPFLVDSVGSPTTL